MNELKFDDVLKFEKEVISLTKKYPNHTKKFLKEHGNKLKQLAVKKAKSQVKKKTGNYLKGFKRGRVYKYNNTEDTVMVYNNSPHAHLIEYGHVIKDKNMKEHGFKKGEFILEKSEIEYRNKFISGVDDLIDDILRDGGF